MVTSEKAAPSPPLMAMQGPSTMGLGPLLPLYSLWQLCPKKRLVRTTGHVERPRWEGTGLRQGRFFPAARLSEGTCQKLHLE